jgi:hypothetical protein
MMTFGVVVNNRDQGFYALTAPIFPGRAHNSDDLREVARVNGYPGPIFANCRGEFSVGPLEIVDDDDVVILYSGTNISDDPNQIPRQEFEKAETKAVSAFYLWMLGAATESQWLGEAIDFLKGVAPGEVGKFLSNPVGFMLGVGNDGPCNGLVYRDALKQKGHDISQLPYASLPFDENFGSTAKATFKKSYSDADYGHNTDTCGAVAHTDVTIEMTRYDKFPVAYWGPLKGGHVVPKRRPYGIREITGLGSRSGTVKQLYGLRN